ncbi:MAG: hypothetical protein IJ354_01725, partial [Clostridia bacterium]|nr:hypothetical protein [Clostridia bacterium]
MSDYYRNQQRPNNQLYANQPDESFLTDAPAQLGAQMQQGGVPLYSDGADFMAQGDDAPTRVARPVNVQMVNRRTSVQQPSAFQRPAPVSEPVQEAPAAQPA